MVGWDQNSTREESNRPNGFFFGGRKKNGTPSSLTLLPWVQAKAHGAEQPLPSLAPMLGEDDVAVLMHTLANARRVVCVTGAGISTSGTCFFFFFVCVGQLSRSACWAAGIADFRSKGGIYDQVQERYPELTRGQELFDANLFRVIGSRYRFD